MRLTKKKALQITADLFGWLEKHPSKEKEDWPGWKNNGGDIPEMMHYCACCEYVGVDSCRKKKCDRCPLLELWEENNNSQSCPCLGEGYYGKWCDAGTPKTRKEYARIIKEGALKELGGN